MTTPRTPLQQEYDRRLEVEGRLERALGAWSPEQIADLCALVESKQLTPQLAREALDPGGKLTVGMPIASEDDPLGRRCSFCHAPPGQPCRTVLYEEHAAYGNGKEHEQPHAARLQATDAAPELG